MWANPEELPGEYAVVLAIEEPGGTFRTSSIVEFVGQLARSNKAAYAKLRMEIAREALSQHFRERPTKALFERQLGSPGASAGRA
jgi:hypothetical protein